MTHLEPLPVAVAPYWADLNEHLCELALVSPDRLDEAPEGEWGVREVAHHIVGGREHWLANSLGRGPASFPPRDSNVTALQSALRSSWSRLADFLADGDALEATYEPPANDPQYLDPDEFTGHYVAFHGLAHDVHHRAQLLDRIRDLGIDVPAAIQRRPL